MVRPVRPDDLSGVARIHLQAFPDSALTVLGAEAVTRYYHWQLTGPHDALALCIAEHGAVTAFCFGGIFRGALRGFLEKNRGYLFWCVARRPWIIFNPIIRRQIATAFRSLSTSKTPGSAEGGKAVPQRSSFGVLAIAVSPATAGKGQAQTLMKCLEDTARQRHFSKMHLTVSPNNTRAVRFYERLGWTRIPEHEVWKGFMWKDLMA